MKAKVLWPLVAGLAAVAVASYAATGALSAPSSAAKSAAAPVKLSLWESHNAGPVQNSEVYLVNWFNRTHPTIHVSIVSTKASTKALAALAAGNPPMLAEISHYDGSFLNAHALLPLNPFLTAKNGLGPQQFYPAVWNNGAVGGQHYRLMADVKVSQLSYNVKMFAQAGIKSPPATWAQLATDLALIKKKFPSVIPMAYKDSSAHILPPFIANGGQLFAPGSKGTKADFLSPAATATFNYFRTLYKNHLMIFAHGSNIRADFGAGHIAVGDGTSAGYQKTLEAVHGRFPVGVFAYPNGSTGHSANIAQGLGFVTMIDHTKAEQQAAGTFIKWWFGPAQQVYWAEHSGYPPETKASAARMPKSFLATHPGTRVSMTELASKYTIPRPLPGSYKEVQAVLDALFFKAVTGQLSVHAALQQLQQQSDAYLSGHAQL